MNTVPPPRRRLRRLAAVLALLLPAMTMLLLLGAYWVLHSESGRDWALQRLAAAVVPAQLNWQSADGVLAGELRINGLQYRNDTLQLQIDDVRLHWQPLALLQGHVRLTQLQLADSVLRLPQDGGDETSSTWEWPALELPVLVTVDQLRLDRAALIRGSAEPMRLQHLSSAVQLRDHGVGIASLAAGGDFGELSGDLHYWPARNRELGAQLRWRPRDAEVQPLTLSAQGDGETVRLQLDGEVPSPLTLALQGHRRDAGWHWQLHLDADAVKPRRLGLDDDATWSLQLEATLAEGVADLQGDIQRDDLALRIAPSQLRVEADVLMLEALALQLPWGELGVSGQVGYGGADSDFDLRLKGDGLLWPLDSPAEQRISADLEARVAGRLDAWALTTTATLTRAGQVADLIAEGRGGRDALTLDRVQLDTPGGTLRSTLAFDTRAQQLTLDGELEGVDPGFLYPDFAGRLHGRVQLQANRQGDAPWRYTLSVPDLQGHLRHRPVQARARWQGGRLDGEGELDLRIARSQVQASASDNGKRWQLRLLSAELGDLWPGAAGLLDGELSAAQGTLVANLRGTALHWGAWRLHRLQLQGQLPAEVGTGELRVVGEGATWGETALGALELRLRGNRDRGHWRLALAKGAAGALSADGEFDARGGSLDALEWRPGEGLQGSLVEATRWVWSADGLTVPATCLAAAPARLCVELQPDRAHLALTRLPLERLRPWLPAEPGLAIEGEIGLEIRAERDAGGWQAEATLASAEGRLRSTEAPAREWLRYQALQARGQFDASTFELQAQAQLGDAGRLVAALRGPWRADAPWQGQLALAVQSLDWIELLTPDIAAVTGRLDATLQLAGSRAAPRWTGGLQLGEFAAELPALGLRLRRGQVDMTADPTAGVSVHGGVDSGEGRLQLSGQWQPGHAARIELQGKALTLVDTPTLRLTGDPDLQLEFAGTDLRVRGGLAVSAAQIDLEGLESGVAPSPDVVLLPEQAATSSPWQRDIDVRVTLAEATRLRGFGLDGRISGELRLLERDGQPPRGRGALDVQGRYRAYGQTLEITRGQLRYANSPLDDPSLDLRVQRQIGEVEVGLEIRGRASSPRSRLVSTPPMDSSEALAWLLLGRPLSGTSRSQAARLGAAASALDVGGSLLARSVGARLGLDEARVEESRTLGGSVLTVGKHLSPRLFIGYGVSLLGAGQLVTLKYALPRGFELAIESGRENSAAVHWQYEH